MEVFFYTKFNLGALCVAVVRSWEVVALRGFLKQLFQWEWRSVPLSLAAVGCLVALWELVVERFDCSYPLSKQLVEVVVLVLEARVQSGRLSYSYKARK